MDRIRAEIDRGADGRSGSHRGAATRAGLDHVAAPPAAGAEAVPARVAGLRVDVLRRRGLAGRRAFGAPRACASMPWPSLACVSTPWPPRACVRATALAARACAWTLSSSRACVSMPWPSRACASTPSPSSALLPSALLAARDVVARRARFAGARRVAAGLAVAALVAAAAVAVDRRPRGRRPGAACPGCGGLARGRASSSRRPRRCRLDGRHGLRGRGRSRRSDSLRARTHPADPGPGGGSRSLGDASHECGHFSPRLGDLALTLGDLLAALRPLGFRKLREALRLGGARLVQLLAELLELARGLAAHRGRLLLRGRHHIPCRTEDLRRDACALWLARPTRRFRHGASSPSRRPRPVRARHGTVPPGQ